MVDGAALMAIATLIPGVIAIWPAVDGDGRGALILAPMTLGFGAWTVIGCRLRR
jgi:hypothetical protein